MTIVAALHIESFGPVIVGPMRPGSRQEEDLLVDRARAGDRDAFEELVRKNADRLHAVVLGFMADADAAQEVTQEAFLRAWRGISRFKGNSRFFTWLYRIGINEAKNYLVALGRRAPTSTEFDSEEAEGFDDADQLRDINTPESLLMSKQIGATVNQAMDELPEELRTAITLRELEGLSYEEIAAVMNCPIGTVRSRIFRAREAIAAKLRPLLETRKDKRW